MRRLMFIFAAVAILSGCAVEYHPYDMRIHGEKDINAANIALIEQACQEHESIRFAVVSDSQRWYDELEDAVEKINDMEGIDFVVHAGDLTDWGMRTEFEMQRDILNRLDVPYVCLLGNHDCLGTGKNLFREIFGQFDFAFTAGDVRFLCLNTNMLEFEEDEPVPNFYFLDEQLAAFPSEARKTVVMMHSYPKSDQFSGDRAVLFQAMIRRFPDLQFCVHGHGHQFRVEDIFSDGVLYYECAHSESETFLVFTINKDGYEYEVVDS